MAIQENCQKSSQPHWKIVKLYSSVFTMQWPYRKIVKKSSQPHSKIVKKAHSPTGKLSKKLTATQESCETINYT